MEPKIYKYFIPDRDDKNEKLPKKRKLKYVEMLKEMACKINGGFTQYYGHGGYYPGDTNNYDPKKVIQENVIIFETFGKNILTIEEMEYWRKYLYQESLMAMETNISNIIESTQKELSPKEKLIRSGKLIQQYYWDARKKRRELK